VLRLDGRAGGGAQRGGAQRGVRHQAVVQHHRRHRRRRRRQEARPVAHLGVAARRAEHLADGLRKHKHKVTVKVKPTRPPAEQ